MEIRDLTGLGEFGSKLADIGARFIEGALRPTQIRRVALADAEAKVVDGKADLIVANMANLDGPTVLPNMESRYLKKAFGRLAGHKGVGPTLFFYEVQTGVSPHFDTNRTANKFNLVPRSTGAISMQVFKVIEVLVATGVGFAFAQPP